MKALFKFAFKSAIHGRIIIFAVIFSMNAIFIALGIFGMLPVPAHTIKISCSDTLNINASGMGDIEYRGFPNISQNTGGMISIKRVN